jgi:hypothetical protein
MLKTIKTNPKRLPTQSSKSDLEPFHAFRTITTMLSLIPTGTNTPDPEPKPVTVPQHLAQELKLLDSLAAVLVRRDEIVAVVAEPQAGTEEGSKDIQVIASVTHPSHDHSGKAEPTIAQHLSDLFSFLVSRNPRKDDLKDQDQQMVNPDDPIIIDPEDQVPDYLKRANKEKLFQTFYDNP